MLYILPEDIEKLYPRVKEAIVALSTVMRKVEMLVTIDGDIPIFKITGYWIKDGIRLDIKLIQ